MTIPASKNNVLQDRKEWTFFPFLSLIFSRENSSKSSSYAGPFKGIPFHFSAMRLSASF